MQDGLEMATDVLCLTLYDLEEKSNDIPTPSNPLDITVDKNSFVTLVSCDTLMYRKYYDNKAVKRTLTVPSLLNTIAEREGVNFSQVLQSALKETLHINDRQ